MGGGGEKRKGALGRCKGLKKTGEKKWDPLRGTEARGRVGCLDDDPLRLTILRRNTLRKS